MPGLQPLWREIRIAWYRWALANMGPLHRDVPEVVHRLNDLIAQRPPIERRTRRSACEAAPGLCARDPACPDRHCPGLHQNDGGHSFRAGIAWPIEQPAIQHRNGDL
jgi:hypothetical protein